MVRQHFTRSAGDRRAPCTAVPCVDGDPSLRSESGRSEVPGMRVNDLPVMAYSHGPSAATLTPAAQARHSLPYVSPSHPHTGWKISMHTSGIAVQTPVPSQSPVSSLQNSPGRHGGSSAPPHGLSMAPQPASRSARQDTVRCRAAWLIKLAPEGWQPWGSTFQQMSLHPASLGCIQHRCAQRRRSLPA